MSGPAPAWVVAARRTPIARLDGGLSGLDAQALAATVLRALMDDAGDLPVPVADVILATAAGPGGNLARRAALDAGLGTAVPGMTVDRQCGGGLDAVALACRLVESGAGEAYLAGGSESASTSPLRNAEAPDAGARGRRFFPRRMFSGGGYDDPGMAESAVTIAREWRISRSRQDAFAARSHARAAAAVSRGDFADEIVPCAGPTGTVALDTCPRPTLTSERLGRFPDLLPDGAGVTAGNASQIADGAAAVLVVSERVAARLGRPGIRHAGSATAGVDPRVCGIGAVAAARALHAADPRRDPRAAGHVAMTEAFASQVLATADALGLWEERLNPRGGAIALGHPWGASGAIQVVRLHAELAGRPGAGDGLALAAIAGGMGTAAWFTAREAS